MAETTEPMLVLVTGATGYIGGRLVPRLLQAGYRVRCLVRDPERLQGRPWLDQVEVVAGDVLQAETLAPAMVGIGAAYYLIHSMAGGQGFHERDLIAARNFGAAAAAAGVGRILYMGGLGDPETELSQHLRSRQDTGAALREGGVPVTEFRAGVIVGSGSLSFELIRYLIERLPVMICPRWLYTCIQPIGIRNVLEYLIAALETPASIGETIEIGGADVLTYGDMMLGYAKARGLTRRLIPVPVLTPRLSSYWVHLVTPIPAAIAEPLIEGLRNEVVVRDDSAARIFPEIKPFDYQTAVELALVRLDSGEVETMWSDALDDEPGGCAAGGVEHPRGHEPGTPPAPGVGGRRDGVRRVRRAGRPPRLALHELGVASARADRPAGGRRRDAARPARRRLRAGGRGVGFLARRGG